MFSAIDLGPPNTELPATIAVAPAVTTSAMLCGVMPPSTSSQAWDPIRSNIARARRILSVLEGM